MPTVETTIAAPPDRVFAVLADGRTYAKWVAGSKNIRAVDNEWPARGAKLHHTVGVGPLELNDFSRVLDSDPPDRLVLEVRIRPAGIGHVTFELSPADEGGTRVTMEEHPVSGPARRFHNPIQAFLLRLRNVATLKRLKDIAERDATV